jgi:hypothetical protein
MLTGRTLLDTLVQSSTVDLFRCANIVVAPTTDYNRVPDDLTEFVGGGVSFSGPAMSGTLVLLVFRSVLANAEFEGRRVANSADLVGELANQLMGRISNRISRHGSPLRVGVPRPVGGGSLHSTNAEKLLAIYGFRGLRGSVVVVITGKIDYSVVAYSAPGSAAQEGDIVVF